MRRVVCGLAIIAGSVLAQTAVSARAAEVSITPVRIEGRVLADGAGLPLHRARITLQPLEAGLTAAVVETGDKRDFVLRDIAPGRYSLFADRDGYLATATYTVGAIRSPKAFYIGAGDRLSDVEFRLHPWAVLSGRIRFDDGEPAGSVRVEIYREYYQRGRHSYGVVTSEITNDRAEYRIYGLSPGAYFLAAT